ncbi:MAG TPA: TonB-dependent receptor [Rhizomicrobium sp.]|nr:TonB-dependent receptor [Rhizomicrobium sp.]
MPFWRRRGISSASLWLAVNLLTPAAQGQTVNSSIPNDVRQLSIEELANVAITSVSRRPEPLAQAPAAVFVISADDIRRAGAINLPEALRLAPNLEVARLNGFSYTISARGFNSPEAANKLLVLIDGRNVYSPLGSTVFWENVDVPLADIARIEVISGPGGTLYGANAVNGVINVVTKGAGDTQGALLDATAGTEDMKVMARYGFSPWDGGALRLYGRTSHANKASPVSALDTSRTGWVRNQGGFRLDQKFDGDNLTLQGDAYANSTPGTASKRNRGYNLNTRWSHELASGSSLEMQAYNDESSQIVVGQLREQLDTADLQVQHNTALWWNDTFIWGGEYRHSKEAIYSSTSFFANPVTHLDIENLFAQDSFHLLDRLKVTTGIKIENSSFSNVDFMPDLRLAWQMTDTDMLWASVSRAVRTPSKVDRQLQVPGFLLPSPRFHSEKLTAYEAGYRGQPLESLSLSLSLYYNLYDDLRTESYTPVTIAPAQLRNGITGDSYGAEAWAKYALTDWWRLSLGANWLQRTEHLKPNRVDLTFGQSLGQDPPYQAQLRSEMNVLEDWEFDAALRSIGHVKARDATTGNTKVLVGAYTEMDVRVGWRATSTTEISLEGFNLLNPRHLEANDPSTYPPQYVPRAFMLNLRQSL